MPKSRSSYKSLKYARETHARYIRRNSKIQADCF